MASSLNKLRFTSWPVIMAFTLSFTAFEKPSCPKRADAVARSIPANSFAFMKLTYTIIRVEISEFELMRAILEMISMLIAFRFEKYSTSLATEILKLSI